MQDPRPRTLVEKIWDDHVVAEDPGEPAILAVDLARAAAARAEFRWADGMSEDLWFSRQLRLAGERVYVDPRVATVHLGQPEILTYAPA